MVTEQVATNQSVNSYLWLEKTGLAYNNNFLIRIKSKHFYEYLYLFIYSLNTDIWKRKQKLKYGILIAY